MAEDSDPYGIPLEPLRPAVLAFPVDEPGFAFVREQIEILQSRYGKTLREAVDLVNAWYYPRGVTSETCWFNDTALHEVRVRMEGRYWIRADDAADAVQKIWRRIENVLHEHAPELLQTLAPGATPHELEQAEQATQLKLPPDLRQSLEIHNGQCDPTGGCLKFCGTMGLMSTTDIIRDWQMLTSLGEDFDRGDGTYDPDSNSLNGDWWRRSCIPFGHCEGNYTCVDTLSSEVGGAGRIVIHVHDNPMEETKLQSYAEWLECVAVALEAGRFDRRVHGFFTAYPQFGDE